MKSCLNQLAAVAAFTVLLGQWNAGAAGLSSLNTDKARELWMTGYLKVEQAAKAVEEDKKVFALELYEEALEVFEQVRKQFPEWNPDVVGFRIQFCTGQIRTLRYAVEIDAEKMSRPDLIQEVKRLRKARDGHEERVVVLETKLAGLATSLEAAEKEKLELAANLAEQGELKAAKETWDARQKALEEELAAVTGRAAELQSQLVEAQGKQAQSAADLAKALKDKQELAEDIGDLEDEIGETRQLKKALKEAGKALKEAEEKASALTGELESVKDRLAKAGLLWLVLFF